MIDNKPVVVFDFETTGLSPARGDRPIEIGAVRIENEEITERFQRLMNPGFAISSYIESLTGISNDMIEGAEPCDKVLTEFSAFIQDSHLVAHNASFDLRFLNNELNSLKNNADYEAACSMLISRRIFPDATDHKLKTLTAYCSLQGSDIFHRALDDAEKTGQLWLALKQEVKNRYAIGQVCYSLMKKIERTSRRKLSALLKQIAKKQGVLKKGDQVSDFSCSHPVQEHH